MLAGAVAVVVAVAGRLRRPEGPSVAGMPPASPPVPLPMPEPRAEPEPSMPHPPHAPEGIPDGWSVIDYSAGLPEEPEPPAPHRLRRMDAASVVAEVEAHLRPLSTDANLAAWAANVEASPETEARRASAQLALSDLLADPELFRGITAARETETDHLVRRRLDLLHDAFLPRQVPAGLRRRIVELEASVESRFVAHRGVVGGREVTDNEIKELLRTSDDPVERREAWAASKTVGALVADDVRELARVRNEAARSLGHRDWFALAVATMEMDEGKLFDTLAEADRETSAQFTRWKASLDESLSARFRCVVSDLRPWHYADPFFQEVPAEGGVDLDHLFLERDVVALTRRTFDGVGLETAPILERSDLFPRERKCQHAFCLDVDRSGDIRVLCNVVPNADWMDTMLHELGHGVFSAGHDRSLPWLLRSCHRPRRRGSRSSSAASWGTGSGSPRWAACRMRRPSSSPSRCGRRSRPVTSSSPAGYW